MDRNRVRRFAKQIIGFFIGLFVICLCWRFSMKNTYTLRIANITGKVAAGTADGTAAAPENGDAEEGMLIEAQGEDILDFGKTTFHEKFIEIEVRPKHPGRAVYRLTAPGAYFGISYAFRVGRFGTIYDENSGGFTGDIIALSAVVVILLVFSFFLFRYFFWAKGPQIYSYNMIYAAGFALFIGMTGILMAVLMAEHLFSPYHYPMRFIYTMLTAASFTFMRLTSPLVLIFSVLMLVSNIELLRHERLRLQNIFGILAAFLLVAGEALGFALAKGFFIGTKQGMLIRVTLQNVYCTAFAYFECVLAGAVICALRSVRHKPSMDRDYIIILGCGFRKDGTLTPLLQGRCDRALTFREKQIRETGKTPVLVPSGGQGPGEVMPEAEAMTRYLISRGIPSSEILREDRSRNTFENMSFSRELIRAEQDKKQPGGEPAGREEAGTKGSSSEKENPKVLFSTTNYHVFRSGVWSNLAGLHAEGVGSRTKWWFWPNAFLRECLGLLVNRLKQELLMLAVLAAWFALLTMLIGV